MTWGLEQKRVRSYQDDVLAELKELPEAFSVEQYGEIACGNRYYPLMLVKAGDWEDKTKPVVAITGGVHGNEECGVKGALAFLRQQAPDFADQYRIVVYPCVSPAAYEIDSRWNLDKEDPNRNFMDPSSVPEVQAFVDSVKDLNARFSLSMDLHETLPNDLEIAAEQGEDIGTDQVDWVLPTAFFVYEDCSQARDRIGREIIEAVSKIAPVCKDDTIWGDENDGGVVYADAINSETSAYAEPVCMDSFLRAAGYSDHAFTTETFADVSVEKRTDIQVTAVSAALQAFGKTLKP